MANKYYIILDYQEGEDAWHDKMGPYSLKRAKIEDEILRKEFAYALKSQTMELTYLINDKFSWTLPEK